MIFLPINITNNHWYLAVVNARLRNIPVLDSQGPALQRPELRHTLLGLEDYFRRLPPAVIPRDSIWKDTNVASWPNEEIRCPHQTDGSSCEVFFLKFIEYFTGTIVSPYFTQMDIDNFRHKLPVLLVDSSLTKSKRMLITGTKKTLSL